MVKKKGKIETLHCFLFFRAKIATIGKLIIFSLLLVYWFHSVYFIDYCIFYIIK